MESSHHAQEGQSQMNLALQIDPRDILEIVRSLKQSTSVELSSTLVTNGFFDSFDIISLVDKLEKKYGLTIPGEEITLDNIDSVEAIVRLLQRIREEKGKK